MRVHTHVANLVTCCSFFVVCCLLSSLVICCLLFVACCLLLLLYERYTCLEPIWLKLHRLITSRVSPASLSSGNFASLCVGCLLIRWVVFVGPVIVVWVRNHAPSGSAENAVMRRSESLNKTKPKRLLHGANMLRHEPHMLRQRALQPPPRARKRHTHIIINIITPLPMPFHRDR